MARLNFKFQDNDAVVMDYLTAEEVKAVKTWQNSEEYTFEFHDGHDTGNPIYIRPTDNTDSSNLPKMDTKNKSASSYKQITSLANGAKLNAALKSKAKTEILAIIANEWDSLSVLADRYWNPKGKVYVSAAESAATRTERVCGSCTTRFDGAVSLSGPNKLGKYQCSECYSWEVEAV
jgi:hypothetical protein